MLEFFCSTYAFLAAAIITIQALILKSFGQPLISKSRTVKFWDGDIDGSENSQHITDWYTVSHVLHGFIFFEILYFLAPNSPFGLRVVIAVLLEAAWEVFENMPFIIERYRQTALSQGYVGDSIVNSVSDNFAMSTGFFVASLLPFFVILGIAIAAEVVMAYMVRDNLTLNVIQLIRPLECISKWQTSKPKNKSKRKE